ncbi:XRE family transcriptional regulator [Ammoniphilus resinae]|uniref:XRE family transcriptional regulator of biofilm formation n=1 Tax=Ammoniphilus resinae TaxID=861532 RepID=A0ABS4GXR7_9BACL|nr:XRE family transcriptional regulator [Ammoniphilus resinae]MBP1935046.1 XRE family transcriptional regulator of biofilm formation [Ammoniphilus resinae]
MIGYRIKVLRQKRRLSLTELADRAGIAKSYLSYIERNLQKNPSIQFLEKIALVLEVDVETLIGEETMVKGVKQDLEQEWIDLARKAVLTGITKEEFQEFQRFVEYTNWKKKHKT